VELLGPFFLIFAVTVGLIVLYVVLRIGAAVLRTAVSMANGFLGTRELKDQDFHVPGGYGAGLAPRPKSLAGLEIPMPDVFQAILINFVSGLVGGVTQTVVLFAGVALAGQLAPEAGTLLSLVAVLAAIPVGLLAQVWVLARMLPTTFGRACAVMACEFLIMLLIVAVLLGGAFAAGFMTAVGGGIGGGVGDSSKMLGH
jgi:hypothetical protein